MKYKCKKCGYEWLARIETEPKECPACKSRYWKEWKLFIFKILFG